MIIHFGLQLEDFERMVECTIFMETLRRQNMKIMQSLLEKARVFLQPRIIIEIMTIQRRERGKNLTHSETNFFLRMAFYMMTQSQ